MMNARWGKLGIVVLAVVCLLGALILAGCDAVPSKSGTASSGGSTTGTSTEAAPATDKPLSLKIGETATYDTLKVTVVSAGKGPKDYAGKATYKVTVKYENSGTEAASFNEFDWKLEDADGARSQDTALISAKSLGSGDIAPGGSKSGSIYFTAGKFTKIIYEPSFLASEENLAAWAIK
jgi:hypothetical protein